MSWPGSLGSSSRIGTSIPAAYMALALSGVLIDCFAPFDPSGTFMTIRLYGLAAFQSASSRLQIGKQGSGSKSPTIVSSPACEPTKSR